MRTFILKFVLTLFLILGFSTSLALAGNIDSTDKIAKGFNNDIGRINFDVATTSGSSTLSVTVTNTELTGYAFGENIGWINLHSASTTSWGVVNDGSGNLSGYAWSTNIGWINFKTASSTATSSVHIDNDGYFHGYAWNNVKGWISFNCEDVQTDIGSSTYCADNDNYKVKTTWHAAHGGGGTIVVPPPPPASCSNGAINPTDCNVCASSQELVGGNCINSCTNGATNPSSCDTCPAGKTLIGGTCTNVCANGAIDPITCSVCPASQGFVNNVCTNICANGATNPPTCDNICTNGANNFPDCNNNVCTNGATNFPDCDDVCTNGATNFPTCNNVCTNGSTNFPICDNNEQKECNNGSSNYPACDNNVPVVTPPVEVNVGGGSCSNGATNSPDCNNVCSNGATNFPDCNNVCTNGSTNFPDCDNTLAGKPCPSGFSGTYPDCTQNTIISNVVNNIGVGYVAVKDLVNTKAGDVTVKTLSTAGVAVTGAVAVSSLFLNPMSFTEILLIPFRLWGLFMSFLGLKRRSRPWGTVYDSITKQPLDPAYVILQDMLGREVTTSITDLDGRYGFFAMPGKFKIVANKTNYIFPSKRLAGQNMDELYKDLYFGDVLDIQQEGEIIAKNIPLDPEKFDWNEVAKRNMKVMRFYSKYDLIFKKASNIFFIAGLIVAVIALLSAPYAYNIVIFSLYIVMIILRIFGIRPKYFGWVLDKVTGFPMGYAIVHIYSDDLQRELMKKVCDSSGRYYALVPPGRYYLVVEKLNTDNSHTIVYNSEIFDNKTGVINRILKV
jgi:hypothetical protein